MLKPSNKWPSTKLSTNVLFFAQLAEELLDPDAFESHRVFSLDTISRLNECVRLYEDYEKNLINNKTLEHPFEEACWSVEVDPVIFDILSVETKATLIDKLGDKNNISDAYMAAIYLLNKLTSIYKQKLEKQILAALKDINNRNKIRRLSSYYFSYVINIGYSREYIYETIENVFFSQDHLRVSISKVSNFFKSFDETTYEYYVYSEVSKDFGSLLSGVGFEVKKSSEKLNYHNTIVKKDYSIKATNLYACIKVKSLDESSALSFVDEVLVNVRALSFLNPQASDVKWELDFYVVRQKKTVGRVLSLPESPVDWLSPLTSSDPKILKDIRRYSSKIIKNFDKESTRRILRSVSSASSARHAPNVESQFIALWSAVEGLLSEPLKGIPRIVHFTNLMLPCVCNRHLHRRSVYIFDLMDSMYGAKFRKIINKEPDYSGMYFHYRLTAILMFDKNRVLRDEILDIAKDNPLAMHRLYQMYEDCKTPKRLKKISLTHEKRVRWQLSRIYRIRNSLVHKVNKPTYIDSVVLNLFEYYIRMLSCVVRSAAKENGPSDLDQIISGIQFDSISLKKLLEMKCKENNNDDELFQLLHH